MSWYITEQIIQEEIESLDTMSLEEIKEDYNVETKSEAIDFIKNLYYE